ncbi:MAG: energy transducer TonB [Terriglobales bacterium]|jgi:TonB family protein
MKLAWIHLFAFVILVHALVWAQQPSNGSSPTLAYENGSIANHVYTNECFGFSLAIPDGWLLMKQVVVEGGKARHTPGGERTLLMMGQYKEGSFGSRIVLTAHDANGSVSSVKDFISNNAHRQVNSDPEHREILKDAYSVDYGGKHFFRADYKHSLPNGGALYQSFVYTIFRGYYIGETLVAASPEELDQAANSLQHIAFRDDQQTPNCVIRGEDSPSPGGIIGVISSKSNTSQSNSGLPQRVSLPQEVSKGLLIKKVPAQYPPLAQQARIQGRIDLDVLISKEGHIQNIRLISGHPMLAPAAINAVKQWQYKPYLVNGQPVEVETEITVVFEL